MSSDHPRRTLLCAALTAVLVVAGCSSYSTPNTWTMAGLTMGSTFQVNLADPDRKMSGQPDLTDLGKAIQRALADINHQMSTYDPESEISRFNASRSTEPMSVSKGLAEVVDRALAIHRESEGAFDITVAPLVKLWGFGPAEPRTTPPTDQEIEETKKRVGSEHLKVTLDPPTLTKLVPELELDLNAIAPGYAADKIARICAEAGFDNVLVDVGGEFTARGRNGSGTPWRVAVERPDRSPVPVQIPELVLSLSDAAVATSGDYRQYFEHDGKYYSHTIDPKTGRSVTHDLASASVVAPDATTADALATAMCVLGPVEGIKLIERLEGVEALLIERTAKGTYQEILSSGMSRWVAEGAVAAKPPAKK